MKFTSAKSLGAALGAGVLATMLMLPQAKGELVYEDQAQQQIGDREATRQAIAASEKAQATTQVPVVVTAPTGVTPPAVVVAPQMVVPAQTFAARPMPAAVIPAQVVVAQSQPLIAPQPDVAPGVPAVLATPAATDVENLSKTELMRRERVRAEVRNEDILQERMEELRLRDEQRRTQQLLGRTDVNGAATITTGPQPLYGAQGSLTSGEVVVAPVTEHPGQAAPVVAPLPAVAPVPPGPVAGAPVQMSDAIVVTQANATTANGSSNDDKLQIFVQPRIGASSMNYSNSFITVSGHFSGGLTLGMAISDSLGLELGYTYSEFGISPSASNPYSTYGSSAGYATSTESLLMKQNLIDAGLKVHLLGPDSKFRPFLSGGASYAKSYVNYPTEVQQYYASIGYGSINQDYTSSSFLAYVGTGFDVRVSKTMSIGALFRYYTVLSESDSSNLYPGYYGGSYYPTTSSINNPYDKPTIGSGLSQSGFYTVQGGATFVF